MAQQPSVFLKVLGEMGCRHQKQIDFAPIIFCKDGFSFMGESSGAHLRATKPSRANPSGCSPLDAQSDGGKHEVIEVRVTRSGYTDLVDQVKHATPHITCHGTHRQKFRIPRGYLVIVTDLGDPARCVASIDFGWKRGQIIQTLKCPTFCGWARLSSRVRCSHGLF